MFVHNINPTILQIFGLEIRYYGLAYVIGFIFIMYWLMIYRREMELSKDDVYDLSFYLILGVVIGARLFHVVFWEPAYYMLEPWKVLYLWQGGMAFHGGLVGVIVAGLWYCKKKGISFLKLADIIAVPAALALGLGRIANFINAELVGRVTDVPWCVNFGDGECRHPYQIYSALKRFAIGGFLFYLMKTKKFKEGFIFWMLVLLLGVGRLFLDFYREDILYLGLSIGQWMSLVMAIIAIIILTKSYKRDLRKLFK